MNAPTNPTLTSSGGQEKQRDHWWVLAPSLLACKTLDKLFNFPEPQSPWDSIKMEPTSLGCWEDCVITCGRCLAQCLVLHRCTINSHSHSCSATWCPSSTKSGKDALAYQNRSISKEFESEVEAFPMTAWGGGGGVFRWGYQSHLCFDM